MAKLRRLAVRDDGRRDRCVDIAAARRQRLDGAPQEELDGVTARHGEATIPADEAFEIAATVLLPGEGRAR